MNFAPGGVHPLVHLPAVSHRGPWAWQVGANAATGTVEETPFLRSRVAVAFPVKEQ